MVARERADTLLYSCCRLRTQSGMATCRPRSRGAPAVSLLLALVCVAGSAALPIGQRPSQWKGKVREVRMAALQSMLEKAAMYNEVFLFIESGKEEDKQPLEEFAALAEGIEDWVFSKIDLSKKANAKAARKVGITSTPAIYVRATGERLELFRYPMNILGTHLETKAFPADPKHVLDFQGPDQLRAVMNRPNGPVPAFVEFVSSSCAECRATFRVFGQAATYFQEDVAFVRVTCDGTRVEQALCEEVGITKVPTRVLFTGKGRIPFSGPDHSLISLDEFFVANEDKFPGDGEVAAASDVPDAEASGAQAGESDTAEAAVADVTEVQVGSAGEAEPASASTPVSADVLARLEALEHLVRVQDEEIERLDSKVRRLVKGLRRVKAVYGEWKHSGLQDLLDD